MTDSPPNRHKRWTEKGNNILDSVRRRAVYGGHDHTSLIPSWVKKGLADMRVPNGARRSVLFVGEINEKGVFRPRATGFMVGVQSFGRPDHWFPYLVTASVSWFRRKRSSKSSTNPICWQSGKSLRRNSIKKNRRQHRTATRPTRLSRVGFVAEHDLGRTGGAGRARAAWLKVPPK